MDPQQALQLIHRNQQQIDLLTANNTQLIEALIAVGMEEAIRVIQTEAEGFGPLPPKRGRPFSRNLSLPPVPERIPSNPPKSKSKRGKASSNYWDKMTPSERSAEMSRRQQVAQTKRNAKLHPRDSNHPKHAEWIETMRAATKKRWEGMTAAQRKKRLKAMSVGRVNGAVGAANIQPVRHQNN
jgi:hypothetical protein